MLQSHLVQLLVKRTAKPLVAAATAGVMPSSNNIGDKIIPAAMPRAPAAMPQTKQIAGYNDVHLPSHLMSPLSDLNPICFFFSPKIRSSLPNEYVRGTATVAGSITTAQYAELPHSTNPLAPSPPFTTADPKIESQVARRYDSLRNGNMSFSSSITLTSSCSQAVVASEEATAILGSWVIRGDDSLGAEASERCSSR